MYNLRFERYSIGILVLILIMIGCNDFLTKLPEDAIVSENFFKNETEFEQAVNGAYAPLQPLFDGNDGDWSMTEWRSDNTHFVFNIDNRGNFLNELIATFGVNSTNGIIEDKWDNDYLIIARSNQLLASLGEIELDPEFESRVMGQALFLRAFAYFDLVKNYGGVPILLEPVESFEVAFNNRASRTEVFDRIISDAREAVSLLPAKGEVEFGRASRGTVNTLLGDIFITLQRWSDAEEALQKVVDSNNFRLLPNYEDIFKPSNKGNDEIIFDIQFVQGSSLNEFSTFPTTFLPPIENPSEITGVSPDENISSSAGRNTPTPDIIAAYEDTTKDERFDASIGFWSGPINITGFRDGNHQELNGGRGIPYIKKYQHPHDRFNENQQNWPVYRYSEVLLSLAEAINEQGGRMNEAVNFLNQVRNRAGLDNYEPNSQTDLREAIWQERRVELAFENKRWNDLVRTGRAVEVMNAFGQRVKENPKAYYFPPGSGPTAASFNVTENKTIYPIPFNEINLNPELDQNPGF